MGFRRWRRLVLGVALSLGGVLCLALFVNQLTATLGALTLMSYVFAYTPLKRHTTLCTIVSARIPGAIPPVMGFTAITGTISPQACALFAILFLWQMPHFLAIAILYKDGLCGRWVPDAPGGRSGPQQHRAANRASMGPP